MSSSTTGASSSSGPSTSAPGITCPTGRTAIGEGEALQPAIWAEEAEKSALASRDLYAEKLAGAHAEADSLIHEATANATRRSERIVADARDKADAIVRQGQIEAAMEKKRAQASIRREITDVSAALTEKLLGREMNTGDHRELIDSFLQEMGDEQ